MSVYLCTYIPNHVDACNQIPRASVEICSILGHVYRRLDPSRDRVGKLDKAPMELRWNACSSSFNIVFAWNLNFWKTGLWQLPGSSSLLPSSSPAICGSSTFGSTAWTRN